MRPGGTAIFAALVRRLDALEADVTHNAMNHGRKSMSMLSALGRVEYGSQIKGGHAQSSPPHVSSFDQ